ncbi:hypothetical protein, partial [Acidisphaera rubrifaciens]|uniref:hypothetical protein n=1 Tax=Acidisphaera rubrifaciens TaxID=50715 RepID=UPI000662BA36
APLAPAFDHLSHSVVNLVDDFLSGPVVKQAVDDFAGWLSSPELKRDIDAFKGYLGSKDFTHDMKAFMSDFEQAFSGLLPDVEAAMKNLRTVIHFLAQPLPKELDIFGMKIPLAPDVGKTDQDSPGFA